MTIDAGKLSPIVDDDPLLSNVWKGKIEPNKGVTSGSSFGFGGGATGGGDDGGGDKPPSGNRPSLSDIVKPIKLETYYDASGMQMAKATIRIYNSSEKDLQKFAVLMTLSDKQGGVA